MKGILNWRFLVIAASVILGLAFFNSLLASTHPDGLERVALDQNFHDQARDSFSIFGDYALPLRHGLLSTGLAGILGVGLTYLLLVGIGKFLTMKKARGQ